MSGAISSGRDLAIELLTAWEQSDRFADMVLNEGLDSSGLEARERSLAAELFLGVIRRRRTLDCLLQSFCNRSLRDFGPRLVNILRLGVYQMVFLERIPAYAAVNCAVEQTKKLSSSGIHKLVNATLRSLDRSLLKEPAESNEGLIRRTVPLGVGQWRCFDKEILAGVEEDPGLHLAEAYSLPAWLARRWWARFDMSGAREIALASVLRGPITLRPNILRTSQRELIEALSSTGLKAGALADGPGVWVEQISVQDHQLFIAGHFQPQGPTAMKVGQFAEVQPGWKVLDFCAGLGTKATHLAELMGDKGLVVASDIAAEKLARGKANAERLGIKCLECVEQAKLSERFGPESFDLVLVDAPCSNSGVLANRPDAKWRIRPEHLVELAGKQTSILRQAVGFVRPGGTLVYGTCSLEPQENEELVNRFGGEHPELVFQADKHYLPRITAELGQWHDGGYIARWQRAQPGGDIWCEKD